MKMKSFLTLKARKRNLYELYYKKPENRITESFIKMLEKTKPSITPKVLELLGIGECYSEFKYGLQVNQDILGSVSSAVILGISGLSHEFDPNYVPSDENKEGDPDAHIYTRDDSMHILIEVKIGNNKLTDDQLYKHRKRFKNVDEASIRVVNITWEEVRNILAEIIVDYDEYHRNYLLIQEFMDLITSNDYRDIFFYNENEHLKDEYLALDTFIKKLPEVTVRKRDDESIDYLLNDINFVTIFPKNNCLILKSRESEMQAVVNEILNFEHFNALNVIGDKNIKDYRYNFRRQHKEGIIVLNESDDLSPIRDLIVVSYNVRKQKTLNN